MPVRFGKQIAVPAAELQATYDFVDILDRTGYVVYNAGSNQTASGGVTYILTRNDFFSQEIASGGNTSSQQEEKFFDENFEVEFNSPAVIRGRAIVNIPLMVEGAASNEIEGFPVISVQRIRDGVSTEMFALTSGALLNSIDSTYQNVTDSMAFELPITKFRAKDKLRLQVQIWGVSRSPASNMVCRFGYSPKARLETGALRFDTGNTKMTFHIPFKIEI